MKLEVVVVPVFDVAKTATYTHVLVVGGSSGIGLETARRARAEGADVIITGRNPERLRDAADEVGAMSSAAFDATDPAALGRFFAGLPTPIDHVMVTAGGQYYARLADLDLAQAHRALDEHLLLALQVARGAAGTVRRHRRRPAAHLRLRRIT